MLKSKTFIFKTENLLNKASKTISLGFIFADMTMKQISLKKVIAGLLKNLAKSTNRNPLKN